MRKPVYVYADWSVPDAPRLMGTLHRDVVRGAEVLSFEYDPAWLKGNEPWLLDPRLQFVSGRQFPDATGSFGMFLDSAPDRWGRMLIQRRAALEGVHVLHDTDYLLAVSDTCRLGGLRFRLDRDGVFLAEDTDRSVPPLHALRELEQASRHFEAADVDQPEYKKWLNLLLAPGSSLGGARPKGSVVDPQGQLWVAKFPSRSDEYDVAGWEYLVYQLAGAAGLEVEASRCERFSKAGSTFLLRRFDRDGKRRIHFASAMNLLGYHDGDGAASGASYLDLVDLIERISSQPDKDLEELWRRIVFNIRVHNTDDHLRNHGFLLGQQGWRLSPVYDVNPQPWGDGLALNISESSNACSIDLAKSVADYFRLSAPKQKAILGQIDSAVGDWEELAAQQGLHRSEIERMKPAFELR